MSVKISKIAPTKALNCNIHPVLYKVFLMLRDTLGAEIVHRRKRKSDMCIEIIFGDNSLLFITSLSKHINTLPEAEKWGFWVICRPQTSPKHRIYKGHRVYLLYLSPVHPKKRRESLTTITPLRSSLIAHESIEA